MDKDIYLFDTRLGLPLPGPKVPGEDVALAGSPLSIFPGNLPWAAWSQGKRSQPPLATLAQIRTRPDLLQQLTVDPRYPYDVTPEQAAKGEIQVACPLSALAPRMRFLEEELSSTNKVSLAVDPKGLLETFQKAAAGQGIPVRIWNEGGDPNTPARVLRAFLPPDEGRNRS